MNENLIVGTKVFIDKSTNTLNAYLTNDSFIFATKEKIKEVDKIIKYYTENDPYYNYKNSRNFIEKAEDNLRRAEKLNYYPPVGALLSSKGDREHDRYAPAFDFKECKNICLDSITIHHALGMGFLFERSENMQILNSQIVLPKHTQRVISTTADATHFVNCKGDILIENCRFENMLDDGTNVHGTCVEVDEVIDDYTVRVSLKHFEQLGFKFAERGDDIWFIIHPSPQRGEVNTVSRVFTLNERFIQLSFAKPLPAGLKRGDILENNTWNPTFTMRGCTIRNHRARSVILKTPLKTIIENNQYSGIKPFSLLKADTVSQKTLSFDKMCFTK